MASPNRDEDSEFKVLCFDCGERFPPTSVMVSEDFGGFLGHVTICFDCLDQSPDKQEEKFLNTVPQILAEMTGIAQMLHTLVGNVVLQGMLLYEREKAIENMKNRTPEIRPSVDVEIRQVPEEEGEDVVATVLKVARAVDPKLALEADDIVSARRGQFRGQHRGIIVKFKSDFTKAALIQAAIDRMGEYSAARFFCPAKEDNTEACH